VTGSMGEIFVLPETRAGRRRRWRRRISVVTALAVLVAGAVWVVAEAIPACGRLWSGVYRVDGECIGVTDGSVLFDDEFTDVEKKIADENAWVQTQPSYVTVALLNPLTVTSALSRDEILGQTRRRLHRATPGQSHDRGRGRAAADQCCCGVIQEWHPYGWCRHHGHRARISRIHGLVRVSPDARDYAEALDGFLKTQPGFRSAILGLRHRRWNELTYSVRGVIV
jgi:hypothetical protein